MRSHQAVSAVLVFFLGTAPIVPQSRSSEIPSHFRAIAPDQNFSSAKTVTVAVTNRRPENPDTPEDLARLRKGVVRVLPEIPFTLASDKTAADFSLELIVEPNVRYGMFHYQNAPYVYLLIRRASSGQLIYCAYQRASHFYSASNRLLHDFEHTVQHGEMLQPESLPACAEQAMRPL